MSRTTNYTINNTVFRVTYGDITHSDTDVIVSSDDNYLTMGGGVSMAISFKGGDVIQLEAQKHIPLSLGDVAVTSAGNLQAKYVFHAITIDFDNYNYADENSIMKATNQCLRLADSLNLKSITFPALGTGVARFPFQLAAEVMTQTITDYLAEETGLRLVILTLFSRESVMPTDLNIFYERAASLSLLATRSRKLEHLVAEMRRFVEPLGVQTLSTKLSNLYLEIQKASNQLVKKPTSIQALEEIYESAGLESISKEIVQVSDESKTLYPDFGDRQLETKILKTKLQGLQTIQNIQTANLNKLLIEKAKYGGIGIPPRLTHSIDDMEAEIEITESKVRKVRMQLASLLSE